METLGRTMSGSGHSECKGPEVGEGLVGSVDREEASLAGAQSVGRSLLAGVGAGGNEGRSKARRALIQNVNGCRSGAAFSEGSDRDSLLEKERGLHL